MANASQVCARIRFKDVNGNAVQTDWVEDPRFSHFKKLFCFASYDGDGHEISDGIFSINGRWSFANVLDFTETKDYLYFLSNLNRTLDLGIHSMQIEYSDIGGGMLRFGIATVNLWDGLLKFENHVRDFTIDEIVKLLHISDFDAFSKDRSLDDNEVSPFSMSDLPDDTDKMPSWDYEIYIDDAFINAVQNDQVLSIINSLNLNEIER